VLAQTARRKTFQNDSEGQPTWAEATSVPVYGTIVRHVKHAVLAAWDPHDRWIGVGKTVSVRFSANPAAGKLS
jgi:hypothetical protein